jgi:hypothetical protein
MPVLNNHHFRLFSALLFGFFLTGSSSAHYITHLHTEIESVMDTGCGDDDHSGHTFHFHTAAAAHADCDEAHCRQASCIAPGIVGDGISLQERPIEPVNHFGWAAPRATVRVRLQLTGLSLQPHRLVTVLRI